MKKYKEVQTRPNFKSRIVTKFLWLPKTINGETRWLSTQTWEERAIIVYENNWFLPLNGVFEKTYGYKPYKWQ